jgi:hypothetical protein
VIHLDGSQHSGSGTLVRFGVSLAALVGEPLHITRALAARRSRWRLPRVTENVESNVWRVGLFGARAHCDGRTVGVEGLGQVRRSAWQAAD